MSVLREFIRAVATGPVLMQKGHIRVTVDLDWNGTQTLCSVKVIIATVVISL